MRRTALLLALLMFPAALCADIPACKVGQPVPGSLCTDACAAAGGLDRSHCFPDAPACTG